MDLIKELLRHRIGAIMGMPDHVLRCHPFVGKSFLNLMRNEEDETEESAASELEDIITVKTAQEDEVEENDTPSSTIICYDRRRAFIVDDGADEGPAYWSASKNLKPPNDDSTTPINRSIITAVAVRERGNEKYSKVLRFLYSVPIRMRQCLNTWVAVPKRTIPRNRLFNKHSDNGHLLRLPVQPGDPKTTNEAHILNKCKALTVDQRCADWFILRQFRITGTTAGRILMANDNVRVCLGLGSLETEREPTLPELLRTFVASWLSTSRSTEQMKRCTANERAVISSLSNRAFVKGVFECGMLGKAAEDWLACSPDGVAFIDLRVLGLAGSIESQQFAISSVEIKIYVAETTLDRAIAHSSADIITCSVGDARFRELIPTEHVGQIMHQMVVLSVNYVMYVAASESGVLFTAVIYCDATILQTCYTALTAVFGPVVSWAHLSDPQVPSFADTESGKTLRSRLSFWLLVNTYVKTKDAFPTLKLFKHSSQSLYSKTKGGVDGTAQARAILRSSTSVLKWEQKIFSQTLKTLTINAFIAWRMSQNRALLHSKEAFRNVSTYRHTLNTTQSMADYVFDLARELVFYADSLFLDGEEQVNTISLVVDEELRPLCDLAKKRKRKRIQFFIGEDGQTLRLNVARHTVKQQRMQQNCGLCGLNVKQGRAGEWRGHRSASKCIECDIHLCVRIYPGLRKSRSELWHSVGVLAPRATPRPTTKAAELQFGGVSNNLA